MRRFRCTIHNIEFDYPEDTFAKGHYCECPWCLQNDLKKAKDELNEVKEHRNALLRAFEIKRTVDPLEIL